MASIKDVAKHAGVAISTVSKVLNHYPNVSAETKEKVNASIKELGYVPNAVASALSSKRSGRIAIIIRLLKAVDEVNMQYLYGVFEGARALNLDVVPMFYSSFAGKSAEEIATYLRAQSISGFILCGVCEEELPFLELLQSQKFWAVSIDSPFKNEKTSYVTIDHYKAQYEVVKKTVDMNPVPCKSILYIHGSKESYVTKARIKAIKQYAKDYNMELVMRNGEFEEKRAREITLKEGEAYDIIACASDLMAIGAMNALKEKDIFRPVCGFDGLALMAYVGKQMNTVKQNFRLIAKTAVQELNYLIEGGNGRQVIVEHTLERLKYSDVIKD